MTCDILEEWIFINEAYVKEAKKMTIVKPTEFQKFFLTELMLMVYLYIYVSKWLYFYNMFAFNLLKQVQRK